MGLSGLGDDICARPGVVDFVALIFDATPNTEGFTTVGLLMGLV
jgi:hypothetical protein